MQVVLGVFPHTLGWRLLCGSLSHGGEGVCIHAAGAVWGLYLGTLVGIWRQVRTSCMCVHTHLTVICTWWVVISRFDEHMLAHGRAPSTQSYYSNRHPLNDHVHTVDSDGTVKYKGKWMERGNRWPVPTGTPEKVLEVVDLFCLVHQVYWLDVSSKYLEKISS